jgi:paraquat-inducible protein A
MNGDSAQRILALALGAAITFALANFEPLLSLSVSGLQTETTIVGGAAELWRAGYRLTAAVVLFCTAVAPAAFALLLLSRRPALLDWAARIRHWVMPEVMVLALVVALVKISVLAQVDVGIGGYAAGASVLLFAALGQTLDSGARDAAPRQREPLDPKSVQRTWALIAAAAICYVPANLLPVLISTSITSSQEDTILSGVVYLFTSGTWPLGLIVLTASVLIPIGKLVALGYLLLARSRGVDAAPRERAQLLRVVNFIGRWSMLDVFVVAFVAALVQLKPALSARPGPGVPFFAAVVILTMLAAMSFDPRLLEPKAPVHA